MGFLGRVLLIDDEPGLRQTLMRVLQNAGCDVTGAADGREALRILETKPFDLVYLDIHLPEMNGLAVLQRIRQVTPQLPVILFTAYASLQSALEAIRLGASDYLVKPIDPEVFIARTRVILEEQAVERRKRQIQEQMAALRAELQLLEARSQTTSQGQLPAAEPNQRFIKYGRLILDLQAQRATLGENVLSIPPTAFEYLSILARHAPDPVDPVTLVSEAQGYAVERSEASELAKYHIHVLRQALAVDAEPNDHILTLRGIGYRLVAD